MFHRKAQKTHTIYQSHKEHANEKTPISVNFMVVVFKGQD